MFLMTVNDPLFKWFLLLGIVTLTLSIVLEIRFRHKQRQQGLRNDRHHDQHKP
ncbi:MAG: hypothetical protein K0R67_1897 [Paenibacillus sp.]|jgi:hypothetical protein|nr:hypothetical protein [Paenibacillus sp.]